MLQLVFIRDNHMNIGNILSGSNTYFTWLYIDAQLKRSLHETKEKQRLIDVCLFIVQHARLNPPRFLKPGLTLCFVLGMTD